MAHSSRSIAERDHGEPIEEAECMIKGAIIRGWTGAGDYCDPCGAGGWNMISINSKVFYPRHVFGFTSSSSL
jgi:hypothetical protein